MGPRRGYDGPIKIIPHLVWTPCKICYVIPCRVSWRYQNILGTRTPSDLTLEVEVVDCRRSTITGMCPATVECVAASGNFPVVAVSVAVSITVHRPGRCRVCSPAQGPRRKQCKPRPLIVSFTCAGSCSFWPADQSAISRSREHIRMTEMLINPIKFLQSRTFKCLAVCRYSI